MWWILLGGQALAGPVLAAADGLWVGFDDTNVAHFERDAVTTIQAYSGDVNTPISAVAETTSASQAGRLSNSEAATLPVGVPRDWGPDQAAACS